MNGGGRGREREGERRGEGGGERGERERERVGERESLTSTVLITPHEGVREVFTCDDKLLSVGESKDGNTLLYTQRTLTWQI